jgi:hypothetical protein
MRNIKSVLFLLVLLVFCFSCSDGNKEEAKSISYSFEVVDSVLVDYLGNMNLQDYDPKSLKYLLTNDVYFEYLEIDESGDILNHNKFSEEGVNPISSPMGLGYFDGKVTVFDSPKGYFSFEDSTIVSEVLIPYSSQVFMMYPKLGMFELDGKVFYPKPWPETLKVSFSEGAFYKALMKLDILESQDKVTGDTLGYVKLPEDSPLLGEGIQGFPIPTYTLTSDKLLLSMWLEPRFYVYSIKNGNFEFEKTVEIDIPGWIPYTPVPEGNPDAFFVENQKKTTGTLTNLFQIGDKYIAIYNKGLTEDQMAALDRQDPNFGSERRKKNPHLVAVFDKDFNQLASNVPIPVPASYNTVVNNKGELVVSKDPSLTEVEDDGIIIYKLKLKEN